jgi:hypothetical protein
MKCISSNIIIQTKFASQFKTLVQEKNALKNFCEFSLQKDAIFRF